MVIAILSAKRAACASTTDHSLLSVPTRFALPSAPVGMALAEPWVALWDMG